MSKTIELKAIEADVEIQARAALNEAVVEEYAEAIAAGAKFPAVVVFDDGEKKWLADGFHRFHAHQKARKRRIAVDLRKGTRRDAILHSLGANADHGLRRGRGDVRKGIETLLADEEWRKKSDAWIAKTVRCDRSYVLRVRSELGPATCDSHTLADPPPARVGLDGKERAAEQDRPKKASQSTRIVSDGADDLPPEDDVIQRGEGACGSADDDYDPEHEEPEAGWGRTASTEEPVRTAASAPALVDIADGNAFEVPESVRAAWEPLRASVHQIDQLLRETQGLLSGLTDFAADHINSGAVAAHHLLRVRAESKRIREVVHAAAHAVRHLAPHVLCPHCKGAGKGCTHCSEQGWWSETTAREEAKTDRRLEKTGS